MLKVKIEPTREEIKSQSGIFPAGRLLGRFGFSLLDNLDRSKTKQVEYPSGELFLSYAGMLCLGYRDFYDIDRFRDNRMFKVALGIDKVPSEATLRERIRMNPGAANELRRMNSEFVWDVMKPSPYELPDGRKAVFADLDVSIHDNSGARKREGVGMTYAGVMGFSPAYVYAGTEGYMLDAELRPGEQHCQNGTPELMRNIMLGAEGRGIRLLFRMDSGNDCLENIRLCHSRRHHYVIACNPRRMDLSEKAEEAECYGEMLERSPSREVYAWRETVYHEGERGGSIMGYRIVRLERTLLEGDGQKLLVPMDDVSMWWTDLPFAPQVIIGLYNEHGTSEQYHSEIKSDLDMEKFPALSFDMNRVVHAAAMIAFNVLRRIGVDAAAMEMDARRNSLRLRIRTVIAEIMRSAGKFVFSGNVFRLRMNCNDRAYGMVSQLYHAYG